MAEAVEKSGRSRERGAGFPGVALPSLVGMLQDVIKYGVKHTETAFANHVGNTSTTGGGFIRKFASFKDFGLVTSDGNDVELTTLGKRLAAPPDPDPEAVQADLRKAFLHVDVFKKLYDSLQKGEILDSTKIANSAFHNYGVSAQRKDNCAGSFISSAIAAGLAERLKGGRIRLLLIGGQESPASATSDRELSTVASEEAALVVSGRAEYAVAGPHPIISQPWPIEGGRIYFELSLERPLPILAFGALERAFEALNALSETLGGPAGADNSS